MIFYVTFWRNLNNNFCRGAFMFFFFLFSFCFSYVLNIDGVIFDEQDFYSKYTYGEWSRSSDLQKKRILEDYIKRSSCVLDAQKRGVHLDPIVIQKIKNRKKQLMVNFAYDHLVAKPLVDSLSYELAKKHIKKRFEYTAQHDLSR